MATCQQLLLSSSRTENENVSFENLSIGRSVIDNLPKGESIICL